MGLPPQHHLTGRALLLDLDGVLRLWSATPARRIETEHGEERIWIVNASPVLDGWGRPKGAILTFDDVTVKLRYDRTEDTAEPKGLTRLAPNTVCPIFYGIQCPVLDDFDTQSGLPPTNGTDSEGWGLTIVWDINDDWQFKSITAHRESDTRNNIDFDTTPAAIADTTTFYFDDQDSQEFQFIYTGPGKLNGVLGFYYFDGFAGGLVPFVFVGGAVTGTTDGDMGTESMAVFGDGSYAVNDKLTFNFGLRLPP